MSTQPATAAAPLSPFEQLRYAREIIQMEGQAVLRLASRLDGEFCRAVELLHQCAGSVIVTGMGKAGLIGQKLAATLASTGTRSHYLHPGEAVHGDLGRIHESDTVLVLSQSGETEEVTRLLPSLATLGVPVVAITCRQDSALTRAATVVLNLGPLQEACALGLAPSTSTTAMLAMGDALALVASRMRSFTPEDFVRFHPGGSLGRKLARVDEMMRPVSQCRLAVQTQTVREIFSQRRFSGRRSGAIMVVHPDDQTLQGIFTDSDLARLFESRRDDALDRPIHEVMTANPLRVPTGSMMSDAVAIMAERKISELPVIDSSSRPLGLIDITDVVNFAPSERSASQPAQPVRSSVIPRPKHLTICEPAAEPEAY